MIVLGFGYEGSKNVIILQTIDGLVKTYWNTISLILIIFQESHLLLLFNLLWVYLSLPQNFDSPQSISATW